MVNVTHNFFLHKEFLLFSLFCVEQSSLSFSLPISDIHFLKEKEILFFLLYIALYLFTLLFLYKEKNSFIIIFHL